MEAWVDGSFDAGTGVYSYAVVIWCDGKETLLAKRIENAEMAAMRNVAGEITGAVRAMKVALAAGVEELVIYHDYEGIEKVTSVPQFACATIVGLLLRASAVESKPSFMDSFTGIFKGVFRK